MKKGVFVFSIICLFILIKSYADKTIGRKGKFLKIEKQASLDQSTTPADPFVLFNHHTYL
jgi:hypothetical protein